MAFTDTDAGFLRKFSLSGQAQREAADIL